MGTWTIAVDAEYRTEALDEGEVYLTLPVAQDLKESLGSDELNRLLNLELSDHSPHQIRRRAHHVRLFVEEIAEGDLVLMSHRTGVAVGEITGSYRFEPTRSTATQHSRPVRWSDEVRPLAAFGAGLRELLLSAFHAPIARVPEHLHERVHTVVRGLPDGYEPGGPLTDFPSPVPFTQESLATVTNDPGVHLVWGADQELLYIGRTGSQRDRLRQHLTGDREASILHRRIGEMLDGQLEREATRDDIRNHLAGCSVTWRSTADPVPLKERLVDVLEPRFTGHVEPLGGEVMTPREFADVLLSVVSMRRSPQPGGLTLHKPVLLLWAIRQLVSDPDADVLTPYPAVEEGVLALWSALSPTRDALAVEHPFWRLQRDSVWQVDVADPAADYSDREGVTRSELLAADARGGLPSTLADALRRVPEYLQQFIEVLVDVFPTELRQRARHELLSAGELPQGLWGIACPTNARPDYLEADGVLQDDDIALHVRQAAVVAVARTWGNWDDSAEDEPSGFQLEYHGLDLPIRQADMPAAVWEREALVEVGAQGDKLIPVSAAFVRILQNMFQDRMPDGSALSYRPAQHSVWLFHGNPKRFPEMKTWLATAGPGDSESWSVSRYAAEMQPGDTMILWMSGEEAGIYALTELTSYADHVEEDEYGSLKVEFEITRLLEDPISRATLQGHPVLQDMAVLRFPQATNYKVTSEEWEALQRLLDKEPSVPDTAHLLFKWSREIEAQTIDLHREVAERHGAVWWGKFGQPGARAVLSAQNLDRIRTQLARNEPTYAFLYRPGDTWRTRLQAITDDPSEVEAELLPDYYTAEQCTLFVRLSEFEELPGDWPLTNLVLLSNPDPSSMPGALSNQRTPLLVRLAPSSSPPSPPPALSMEWLESQTMWQRADLEELMDALRSPTPQVVLAGPPGTGKTWVAEHMARYLTQDRPLAVELVQFHPSYGYEEFIEGLRPETDDGKLVFKVREGILKSIVSRIAEDDHEPYVLIIDEMNRANLSKVFGELMYLFEYRGKPINLQYSQDFQLPTNLAFVGTMNTADRSIRSIDIALRRRFEVFECAPDARILARFYENGVGLNHLPSLVAGFEKLNAHLESQLDRHHTIGHTFFMARSMDAAVLRRTWQRRIGPLIEEYFFDQPDVAAAFSPDDFWNLP